MKKMTVIQFLLVAIFSQTLFAQTKDGWDVDNAQRNSRQTFVTSLKQGRIDEGSRPAVSAYLSKYYFPRWTSKANVSQLNSFVKEFRDDMSSATGAARDYFLGGSAAMLKRMADDAVVSPQARYIAMFELGNLNQTDSPVTPFAAALPRLVEAVNANLPDSVRIAALIGVNRHAQIGIADEEMRKNTVPTLLMSIAKDSNVPETRTPEIHNWFRLRALEGLANLKSAGDNGEVVMLLLSIINDAEADSELRYFAARAIGDLDLRSAQDKIDFKNATMSLALLAQFVCKNEQEFVDLQRRRLQVTGSSGVTSSSMMMQSPEYSSESSGGYSGSEYGQMTVSDADTRSTEWAMTRIKFAFSSILNALSGGKPLSSTMPDGAGVVPRLGDDVETKNIILKVAAALVKFNKFLDEGPEEAKKTAATASRMPSDSSMMPIPQAPKGPKVNMLQIKAELDTLNTQLSELLSSASAAAANP